MAAKNTDLSSKLAAVLRLTRIEHSIMLVIAVIAAEIMAGGMPSITVFALSMVTPIFVSMAAFAINDYFDIGVDRRNRRQRPLVTGEITPNGALRITAVCLAVGIGASSFINPYALAIAALFGALALLYSYRLKELLFWGNAYVAFSMAIPFIYGNYVVSSSMPYGILLVSAMIFLSGLAREIHGTIRDMKGDAQARAARTFPRVIGRRRSAFLALSLYALAIAISAYLFFAVQPFRQNLAYALPILAVDIMLAYLGIEYLYRKGRRFYGHARNVSLAAMALALATILLSALLMVRI